MATSSIEIIDGTKLVARYTVGQTGEILAIMEVIARTTTEPL